MTIYLWEHVHVAPGHTVDYMRGFSERWLPLSDKYDSGYLTLSGFFMPGVFNATMPTVQILWTLGDWESWNGRNRRASAAELLHKTQEFFAPAASWRTGWTDKMLDTLPFSPIPPVRPAVTRSGATVIIHQFHVRPDQCGAFVDTFRDDVVPGAERVGLKLELFTRVIGHPTEYIAFWTIPSGKEYTRWRSGRNSADVAGILPNFGKAWSMLIDVEEKESSPTWFSPLGGTNAPPEMQGEEDVAV